MSALELGLIVVGLILLVFVLMALQNIHAQLGFMSGQLGLLIRSLTGLPSGSPAGDFGTLNEIERTLEEIRGAMERIAVAIEERDTDAN